MLSPSKLNGRSPSDAALLLQNVAIGPPYPLPRRHGDDALVTVANPQPHRPVDSSRKPEQAARADIDDLGVIRQDAISRLFRYFHELIHIVQWRLLGPERFLADYADGLARFGYRDSPLEVMAYDAQARFGRDPEPFDAELFVSQSLGSQ